MHLARMTDRTPPAIPRIIEDDTCELSRFQTDQGSRAAYPAAGGTVMLGNFNLPSEARLATNRSAGIHAASARRDSH